MMYGRDVDQYERDHPEETVSINSYNGQAEIASDSSLVEDAFKGLFRP